MMHTCTDIVYAESMKKWFGRASPASLFDYKTDYILAITMFRNVSYCLIQIKYKAVDSHTSGVRKRQPRY